MWRFVIAMHRARSHRTPTPTAHATISLASMMKAHKILGMMPHPERLIDPALGGIEGLPLFHSLLNTLH